MLHPLKKLSIFIPIRIKFKKVNKQILRLAVPNILSNISVPLLSSVDTAVVGHLDKISYLGAVAVGSMIFNFLYWAFGFLRMGTTGKTAQAFGKRDNHETTLILARALSLAILISIILILFQEVIAGLSFSLINSSSEVELYGRSYFDIRIYAAPATLSLFAIQGWFLGMQNARYPLFLALFTNIANIFFNLLLIYEFDMNSDGVALGTVIAQYLGVLFALFLLLKKYRPSFIKISFEQIFQLNTISEFLSLNFDIFIRTLALIFCFSFFTIVSAGFGDNTLAANTILLQFWMLLSYAVDGFAFASESLVGKSIGRRDSKGLKEVITYSFRWGIGFGFTFSLIYFFFGEHLISLFTDNKSVLLIVLIYLPWTWVAPVINSFCFIWDGIYIGALATKAMRNSMLVSTIIFFLPVYYIFRPVIGNHALWLAMIIFMSVRGLTLFFLRKKHLRGIILQ